MKKGKKFLSKCLWTVIDGHTGYKLYSYVNSKDEFLNKLAKTYPLKNKWQDFEKGNSNLVDWIYNILYSVFIHCLVLGIFIIMILGLLNISELNNNHFMDTLLIMPIVIYFKLIKYLMDEGFTKRNPKISIKNVNAYNIVNKQKIKEKEEIEKIERKQKEEREERERKELFALNNSPLYNYFEAVEGGETTFYYLKLLNEKLEVRYKVGVTINSVASRYSGYSGYTILYEKKLTHANTIEKKILRKFSHLITNEQLLGTSGTEIFKEDVLKLHV